MSASFLSPFKACYDEGKRASETISFEYHRIHGVQVIFLYNEIVINKKGVRIDYLNKLIIIVKINKNKKIRVVRIFNTYGPRMHPYDGRVISNFIRQVFLLLKFYKFFLRFELHFLS